MVLYRAGRRIISSFFHDTSAMLDDAPAAAKTGYEILKNYCRVSDQHVENGRYLDSQRIRV
jgi:hypothetical protein